MPQGLPRLLFNLGVLALPLLVALALYPVLDPFKVVRRYSTYYDTSPVILNRDVVSTEYFLQNYSERQYDSFIFGSSRSIAFHTADWQRYLPPGSRPFHFDAWSETLYGIWSKLKMLEARKVPVRQALIIVDADTLGVYVNIRKHLFIKHHAASGESPIAFHGYFLSAYFSHAFFVKYFDWKLLGTRREYMSDVFEKESFRQVPVTNDLIFQSVEEELAQGGAAAYYQKHRAIFTPRKPGHRERLLEAPHLALLSEVGDMLRRFGTRVQVVVGPNYDQLRMAEADRRALEQAFGGRRVCDFSGVNEWTQTIENYYERSHYRPHVARDIMRVAYGEGSAYCETDKRAEPNAAMRSSAMP